MLPNNIKLGRVLLILIMPSTLIQKASDPAPRASTLIFKATDPALRASTLICKASDQALRASILIPKASDPALRASTMIREAPDPALRASTLIFKTSWSTSIYLDPQSLRSCSKSTCFEAVELLCDIGFAATVAIVLIKHCYQFNVIYVQNRAFELFLTNAFCATKRHRKEEVKKMLHINN